MSEIDAPLYGGPPVTIPPDLIVSDLTWAAAPQLWHLPQAIWSAIWSHTQGQGVTVAILDTGMNSHPDLPEPKTAYSFIRGQTWRDGNGHGTHCAGTALGRNGIGVAPAADLIVGKVLSNGGSGGSDGIAAGIAWAVDQGADVISMSLGGGSAYEPTRRAIVKANDAGAVVVAAAGNAGFNGRNTIGYPGKFLESLCVGATREDGRIASFSSGGRELDVATPGQNIISASARGGYVSMSGTSMATPFFAGLCALIIEQQRREGHAQLSGVEAWRAFLEQWSEDRGDPGRDVRYGYGVPRAASIVEALAAQDLEWV